LWLLLPLPVLWLLLLLLLISDVCCCDSSRCCCTTPASLPAGAGTLWLGR
jgi:hypothetical protein